MYIDTTIPLLYCRIPIPYVKDLFVCLFPACVFGLGWVAIYFYSMFSLQQEGKKRRKFNMGVKEHMRDFILNCTDYFVVSILNCILPDLQ